MWAKTPYLRLSQVPSSGALFYSSLHTLRRTEMIKEQTRQHIVVTLSVGCFQHSVIKLFFCKNYF